ncbi:hypothetical protein Tco_0485180 [Tanacetum coccineum]
MTVAPVAVHGGAPPLLHHPSSSSSTKHNPLHHFSPILLNRSTRFHTINKLCVKPTSCSYLSLLKRRRFGLNCSLDSDIPNPLHPQDNEDREVKRLKRSRIPLIKVRWNSKRGPEFTWEREDQFKKKYPHLFTKTAPSSSAASSTTKATCNDEFQEVDPGLMTDTRFVQYTGIEVQHFRDTLLQHLGNVKKSVAERTRHQRQYERRVNKRQVQTQESKIDTGKALDADLVDTESIRTGLNQCKGTTTGQGMIQTTDNEQLKSLMKVGLANLVRHDMVHNHYLDELAKDTREEIGIKYSVIASARFQALLMEANQNLGATVKHLGAFLRTSKQGESNNILLEDPNALSRKPVKEILLKATLSQDKTTVVASLIPVKFGLHKPQLNTQAFKVQSFNFKIV